MNHVVGVLGWVLVCGVTLREKEPMWMDFGRIGIVMLGFLLITLSYR